MHCFKICHGDIMDKDHLKLIFNIMSPNGCMHIFSGK